MSPIGCTQCKGWTDQHDRDCPRHENNWDRRPLEVFQHDKNPGKPKKNDVGLPAPARPEIAFKKTPARPDQIEKINQVLIRPWNSYDRSTGRSIAAEILGEAAEFIVGYFIDAGWDVTHVDDQRDGNYYLFKPRS